MKQILSQPIITLIRQIHFYVAIFIAPFLFISASSGAVYALAPIVQNIVYHKMLYCDQNNANFTTRYSFQQQVNKVVAEYPQLHFSGLVIDKNLHASTQVLMADSRKHTYVIFVDPIRDKILGKLPYPKDLPIVGYLQKFHEGLLLGPLGKIYSEISASWLWFLVITGVFLWVQHYRKVKTQSALTKQKPYFLKIKRSEQGRKKTLSIHGVVGIWATVVFLILSATGLSLSEVTGKYHKQLRALVHWNKPSLSQKLPQEHITKNLVDIDKVIATIDASHLVRPYRISYPSGPNHPIIVREQAVAFQFHRNWVSIDPFTAQTIEKIDFMHDYPLVARILEWCNRFHTGHMFGLINQIIILCAAIALVTLIVTGYRMWWLRSIKDDLSTSIKPGSLIAEFHELSDKQKYGVVIVVIVLMLLLPLWALSLLLFILIDMIYSYKIRKKSTPVSAVAKL